MDNYEGFKKDILALTKIDLNAYKEKQMKRRIDAMITKRGYTGYSAYVSDLKKDKKILEEFISYMTINVSEFYRNPEQWDTFEKVSLPNVFEKFGKKIKIWSAACSTGDEPYTIAMILEKYIPKSNINIVATDIDKQILEKASVGIYDIKSLKGLPELYLKKHFTKITDTSYQISNEIKSCVKFERHNLLKDPYPSDCHIVVCRNVLIYFTEEAKKEIYVNFNHSLKKDGLLFVGSTEQIIGPQEFGFYNNRSFFYIKTDIQK